VSESAEPSTGRTYGGLSPSERLEARRARLLEVGRELFADQGFASTGVRELCRAAKIGERAFYEAAGSREALLRDVYLEATDEVVAGIAAALAAAGPDIAGRLHVGLSAFFASITEDPRRGQLIYVESLGRGPDIEVARREGLGRFVALARRELGAYLPEPAPSAAAVDAAVSAAIIAIGEIAYRIASGEIAFSVEDAVDRLTVALAGAALALGIAAP